MKFRIFFSLKFLFAIPGICLYQCASGDVRYEDAIQLLQDNFWIDKNTLQIQVEAGLEEDIPYSWRHEKSCKQARELIDEHFKKLYPSANNLPYQKIIYKRLYTDKNNCRLVVHLRLENLKDKIK